MNHKPRRPIAISYARFSSQGQARGTSEERQEQAFAVWLDKHPEFESQSFIDRGISAYSGKNRSKGSLAAILELIGQSKLRDGDCLVIEAIDRLSRQETTEALRLILDILRAGVSIVTLEDGQTYDQVSMAGSGAYILIGKIQGAHDYSKRLGSRISASHESKRAKARALKVADKLVTVPWIKEGKLNEPFAGLVRRAVDLYLQGRGHRAICIELQSLIDQDELLKARYGKPLHASTVKRWLNSPELVGDWDSTDGLIHELFEPLLSEAEYQQVQNLIRRRQKKPTKQTKYLISGLIKCNDCGGAFHTRIQYPHATKDAPKGSGAYAAKPPILYCNCSNYLKNGSCNNKATWPYQVLHFILMSGLSGRLYEIERSKPVVSGNANQLKAEIAELEAKQSRYGNLYADLGDNRYRDLAKSLNPEIAALRARLIEEKQSDATLLDLSLLSEGIKSFFKLDDTEQNLMLRKLGLEVQIHDKKAWRITAPEQAYELVRRSQKHAAYIVKRTHTNPEGSVDVRFYAIDGKGRTSFMSKYTTEQSLMASLDGSDSGPNAPYFFKSLAQTMGAD